MVSEEVKKEPKKKAKKVKDEGPKKIRPEIDEETTRLLELRSEKLAKQPHFKRGEWFRYKKLGTSWRRPRAVTNKQRLNRKYRPSKVRIGFGKPALVRDYHPSGFKEIMVFRVVDLEGVDPKIHAARIGSTVGTRKRKDIVKAADARGIRILNRGVL